MDKIETPEPAAGISYRTLFLGLALLFLANSIWRSLTPRAEATPRAVTPRGDLAQD